MPAPLDLLLGEFPRSLDERYRLSIPPELAAGLLQGTSECILAKERAGCLSLWNAAQWQSQLDQGVDLVAGKLRAGKLASRIDEVQLLGRLLSTRHRRVQIAGRGRLVLPEGFREFLQVEPGGDVFLIGAAVCVELWQPAAWLHFVTDHIPNFRPLLDRLSG
jgi:MraZ protein